MNQTLNDFIYYSKYSKYNHSLNRKETFSETIERVFEMHTTHLFDNYPKAFDNATFCDLFMKTEESCKKGYIYGSQRALQFGGNKILTKNARLYNCAYSYCDRPEFFGELLWILLCGCGVGCSVHTEHINKLPTVTKRFAPKQTFIIEDSIEGWADAIHKLINSYFQGGHELIFDYSKIRPSGSFISGGFIAPGPDGLRKSIENITKIFDNAIDRQLRPIECYSICCHLADSVLSGGVRRSALSTLFDPNDDEMRNAKTGNWFIENPHFARSNNSIMLIRNKNNYDIYSENFDSAKQFGEPGFAFLNNIWEGFNPCFEIGMEPRIKRESGINDSGWLFCNLTTLSGKDIETKEQLFERVKLLSFLGTIQASYNKFPYLGEITEALVLRDSLLGCSISGIMTNPDILLDPEILKKAAEIVKETNRWTAEVLGINPAARTTCIKPDGNFSSMTGNSPGCHPAHSKRYIRRVQVNKDEEAGQIYKKYNPNAISESVWSNNNTDIVIAFAIEQEDGTIFKKDLNAIEHLEYVKIIQENWVNEGNNNKLENNPSHNVSVTVLVDDNEWDDLKKYIWNNQRYFSGISMLPRSGDLMYNQAAYSEVLLPEEMIKTYGNGIIFASGLIVDILDVFGDLWKACDVVNGIGEKIYTNDNDVMDFLISKGIILPSNYNDLPYREVIEMQQRCKNSLSVLFTDLGYPKQIIDYLVNFNNIDIFKDEIKKYLDLQLFDKVTDLSAKRDIIRRIHKFSKKYFNNNLELTLNALKHVQLYHDWCSIISSHKEINWTNVNWKKIENIEVNTLAATSCSGGACDIVRI